MTSGEEPRYPGPEGFWRQSPELMGLQKELEQLWDRLEQLPQLPEPELTSMETGEIIAIKSQNRQYTDYRILELGSTPRMENRYPRKPYHILPRVAKGEEEPQIEVDIEKWPSGYRINGEPVVEGFDWNIFVHQGEATFKRVPASLQRAIVYQAELKREQHQVRVKS